MNRLIIFIKDMLVRCVPIYHMVLTGILRQKQTINVVFFAASVSMWRYQHIYELMSKCPRFKADIILHPASAYNESQKQTDVDTLKEFFTSKGIPFILADKEGGGYIDIRKELSPDILFYPQPYNNFYPEEISYSRFYDKLLCYIPYAFWDCKGKWSYDQPLHRMAWKMFYSTDLHRKDAECYSCRRGKNMEIVGYPSADDFCSLVRKDVWKIQDREKKRIIWAPHFTVIYDGLLLQSNFLWMSSVMLEVAQEYNEQIQFVFKPHPRLYSELCKHPDWGESKVREYYKLWESMDNTQVEMGEFVDLFMTSDAMIHDCGSFSVEYHYSENPVMYIAQNFEEQVAEKNDLGKLAMNLHYVGKAKEDIIDFIENIVLRGNDPMKPQRQQFKQEYLLPPNGKTVAENTMDVFLKAFC